MVYEFSFKNYRSYKSETILDFTAKPIPKFENSLIKADHQTKLIPVCAIYGANGAGKSNVLKAFHTLQRIITEPVIQAESKLPENKFLKNNTELPIDIKSGDKNSFYYKWDDESSTKPTMFNILFQSNNKKYRYELSIKENQIAEENLYFENMKNGQRVAVFERDLESIYICDELNKIDIKKLKVNIPFISHAFIHKNIALTNDVVNFFMNIKPVNSDIYNNTLQNFQTARKLTIKYKDKMINIIKSMGINIYDFNIEYDDGKAVEMYIKRESAKGSNIKPEGLKFSEESSGMRKLFTILPVILSGMEKGCFFTADDLDINLHPVLLKKIIQLFTNPKTNPSGAQILFTAHDLTTMSSEILRRDEIWFSSINGYNESVLYCLSDFKHDNNSNDDGDDYNKQYLKGRYGANPYIKHLKNWKVT